MVDIEVGSLLPELTLPPISRHTLALYCGASGDHNPIHVDIDFARGSGLNDVIAHGMLSMAYLGRLLTNWRPQAQLRSFSARFTAMTGVGDAVSCSGSVAECLSGENGEALARVMISAKTQNGGETIVGEAIVAL